MEAADASEIVIPFVTTHSSILIETVPVLISNKWNIS
jgi:hypothetical protein